MRKRKWHTHTHTHLILAYIFFDKIVISRKRRKKAKWREPYRNSKETKDSWKQKQRTYTTATITTKSLDEHIILYLWICVYKLRTEWHRDMKGIQNTIDIFKWIPMTNLCTMQYMIKW